MSQIMKISLTGFLLVIGLALLGGCGSSTPNSQAVVNGEGQHPGGWLPAGHMIAALEDQAACTECHGSDYLGGIAGVSCFKCHLGGANAIHPLDWTQTEIWAKHASYAFYNGTSTCSNAVCHGTTLAGVTDSGPSCTSCHLGGVGSFHPTDWGQNTLTLHGAYVDTHGNTACANAACHGTSLTGVTGSGPSCTSCHLGDASAFHPISFGTGSQVLLNHAPYVTANGSSGCATASCHGVNLTGGIGPACMICHTSGSYPFTATGCTSCHGNPPSGNIAPNRAAAHNALTGHFATRVVLPDDCNTCHNSAGAGTVNHFNGVTNVLFLSSYNAKSGPAVYNPDGTCSTASCHGGQQTPAWLTGAIDVNTQCTSCHVFGTALATPEYNSFYSGRHVTHVNSFHFPCTYCHDTTKLAVNHFTRLDTTTMEGPASATINSSLNYNGVTCTPACHDTRSW